MSVVCPLIEISGEPHERGLQHGKQAKVQIEKGIGHYAAQLTASGFDRPKIHDLARNYLPMMENYEASYVEEMRGIAEGAEAAFEDILMLNARTEIVKLGQNPALRKKMQEDASDECTSALALPEATASGNVIQGQNWDWKVDCAESSIILKIRRDDGPDVLTYTEAGALARSGMNSAGISVTSNYLDCERDYREIGVPLLMTRRKILEASFLPQINGIVFNSRRSGSNNLVLSHVGGVGYDLECAPDEVFWIFPEDGMLTHANHWESPVARAKLRDLGIATTPDTLVRGFRARQLLAREKGNITRETFKRVFLDDHQAPFSICRPVRRSMTMTASATVASIILEPAVGVMEVAMLPAQNPNYTTYKLEMEESARADA